MPPEPAEKRVIAFFDGQNLFHAAQRAFGYDHPNYDPRKLAEAICASKPNWKLTGVRFYTGIPSPHYDPAGRGFWNAKLAQMGRQSVNTYSRELKYEDIEFVDKDGKKQVFHEPREKGVDVRLAIDVIVLAYAASLDVALLFSQDQDFTEVVDEVRQISIIKGRWLRTACAYPPDGHAPIHGAEPIEINRPLYDACLDARDYREAMGKAEAAAVAAGIYKPLKPPFNPPRRSN